MRSSRDAGSRVRRFQPSFPFPAFSFLYIFAKRYEEDQEKPVKTVMIDSKGSFANRAEETTTEAMRNGEGVLSKMPRIAVQYDTDAGKEVVYDNQLPHRGFDGHIEYPLAQTEGKARYLSSAARKQREVLKAPWVMALYLEINAIACNGDIKNSSEWKPQESEFVNWAVALHRFLVKEWGIDPSPALVGKYAPGIARPANNVSIQIIDADFKQRYSQQIRDDVVKLNPGFLILIPSDMSKGDIGKLRDVCAGAEGKSLYYAPEKSTLRIGKVTTVDAEHFWKPVAPGMCRYWAVRPMAIAETRPIPDIKLHRKWGVYEALCLSIGHVWRSQYPQSSEGSREERYWNIVDVVSAKTSHFRIYNYRTVHRANMTDYVHRANGSNILHGMNALIAISDAGESLDCAAMAIGQSRHLGGGFLVPADFAVSVCQSDDDFEKGIPTWLK